MARTFRIVTAVLLLVTLSFFSGALLLSGAGLGLNTGAAASTAPEARSVALVKDAPASPAQQSDTPSVGSAAGGVLDARPAVRLTGPAVVTIVNTLDAGRGQPGYVPTARGSGVIVDRDGHIVTNFHVIEDQRALEVIFSDGRKAEARLVGSDSYSDLAVVKVDGPVPAVAELADSDQLEPGQPVIAIGSALGDFRNTVTVGVVSALHRDIPQAASSALRNLIQTDAAINHGNSGGPLLQADGKVIGINVAVVRGSGIGDEAEGLGFAIPSNTVRQVVDQLVKTGAVQRPYLGISFQAITPQIAAYLELDREQGIWVREVVESSPAAAAGIKQNDIITRFDAAELTSESSLLELLMKHKVGDTVTLTVVSAGSAGEREVTVTLASRPQGE